VKATIAALVAVASLWVSPTKAVETSGMLALACEGAATDKTDLREPARPEPVSMGLIIDFTTMTVAGFERVFPTFRASQVKIIVVDETNIGFSGTDSGGGAVFGQVDRITGNVEALTEHWNQETNKLQWATGYSLKCKPTQRMF